MIIFRVFESLEPEDLRTQEPEDLCSACGGSEDLCSACGEPKDLRTWGSEDGGEEELDLDFDEMADVLRKFGYSVEEPEEDSDELEEDSDELEEDLGALRDAEVALTVGNALISAAKPPRIALDGLAVTIQRADYNPAQNVITLVPSLPLVVDLSDTSFGLL